jgi:uncharacterized protein (TIGR02677 family)
MSKVFFIDLKMPMPAIYLNVGSGSHAVQTAKIMVEFEKVCIEQKPDMVLVVGDVNSTVACTLVAVKLGIKCVHVESGLRSFVAALRRRAELQSVALDDILARLVALGRLARESPPDAARLHAELRDLVNVFDGLANNAEAFMAGLERTIELQRADLAAVMSFKSRLIDYLQRFIGERVTRSSQIADEIAELAPMEAELLRTVAEREARDAAPGDAAAEVSVVDERLADWRERWAGLRRWFMTEGQNSQAALLRKSALAAIPRLLQAVSLLNERRSGRSDRAADFRQLALWFAETDSDASAHRLWRAAFALSPARHLALICDEDCGANTP